MSSPLGQSHRQHQRSPGAQAAELRQVWQELCVREHQARDRNRQLLRDFGHLETQLELLWARTDAVRRRKVDYGKFLQRLLLHPRMEAGSPGQVPQHQDWASAWTLDLPLRSRSGRHLPDPTQWMNHQQYRTWGPHPISPTQSPEPAAFLESTGAGGAGSMEARPTGVPHGTPWLHRGPIAKDHGYRMLAAMPHQESSLLLPQHRLGFPNTAESKGAPGEPMWGEEEEGSEEEEGLEGRQGGQEGGEEEEGSAGPAVGGTEGHVQEEDADSDLVLGALRAGAQGGPGTVEQGRGRGRETPAWDSHTPESPQDLGQLSTCGEEEEEEEEEAESEGDEDIEAALAPQGNATEPRMKRRTSESHEWRRGSQRSPRLEEGSRKVKVVEAPPTSTTQWPRGGE
ncbi:uncharacterized protein LOC123374024 [Mauremys mutica]|uniref:uncharacterized protein LOC123374024 n=1 Tax=Mauremys mutica TaxID=74926 RepID=UPI001D161C0D|nr:uncharacterized protein LOC123374024 [Mauremys mutica]